MRIPWTLVRLTEGRDPRRGEIVVFDSPADGISLVKRVVGVPGDTIALGNEGLVINGLPAKYEAGDVARIEALLEHDILRMPGGSVAEYLQPVRVPEGMYFMMGDNRDNSRDSRYIGFVPRRNIVGRASRVVMSFDPENHYAPRGGRFFEPLDRPQ